MTPVFFDSHVCNPPSTFHLIGREMDFECGFGRRWRLGLDIASATELQLVEPTYHNDPHYVVGFKVDQDFGRVRVSSRFRRNTFSSMALSSEAMRGDCVALRIVPRRRETPFGV
jgi:hypothetical protein